MCALSVNTARSSTTTFANQSAEWRFGDYRGAMIGDGEVWFSEQQCGGMKVITVNPTAGGDGRVPCPR
jgi:hypothetical protein